MGHYICAILISRIKAGDFAKKVTERGLGDVS